MENNQIEKSKCHKVIALNTTELTSYSSVDTVNLDNGQKINPPKNLEVVETKNLQGYKFFDTFLTKKFFKISEQLIQFIEKNYKCIVQQIRTRFVISKNRQPYLLSMQKIIVKPAKKITQIQDFITYKQKGYVKIQEYVRCLNKFITEFEKSNQIQLNKPINNMKKFKCHGDFFGTLQGARSVRSFNLDPQSHFLHKFKILQGLITAVNKRKQKVVQKYVQSSIVSEKDAAELPQDSSQYEDTEQQSNQNVKFDQRSGNLIEKKDPINNQGLRLKTQSQKKFLPLISKRNDVSSIHNQNQLISQQFSKKNSIQKNNVPKHPVSSMDRRHTLSSEKLRSRISSDRKLETLNTKNSFSKNKLQNTNKFQQLDPPTKKQTNKIPTKGNRLMSLSKAGLTQQGLNTLKNRPKINSIQNPNYVTKAKNLQQAQKKLVEKLSLLPSSSIGEFIHYAKRYYETNLPQQLDRKCFSSEYLKHLYSFMMNSNLNLSQKNRIKKRPQINLHRLSQLTNYPQIVSKSAFYFDTLITDQKTTIPFCVITTKMINNSSSTTLPYQNIFIINDIFDCFIQYIPLTKDLLQNSTNKRVILFNYPGQSHTIYDNQTPFHLPQFTFILDKLLYRLSQNKDQLGYINFKKDKFKFISFGYGGYLTAQYLSIAYQEKVFNQKNMTGLMLINTYKTITKQLKQKTNALLQLYQNNDQNIKDQAYLFYSKAIQSPQTDKQQLQYKAGLNPIRIQGRVYLLKSLLDMSDHQTNNHNTIIELFQYFNFCPVHIIYGRVNNLFTKSQAHRFLIYQDTQLKKQQISGRKFIELEGGHDLLAGNYQGLFKYLEMFLKI